MPVGRLWSRIKRAGERRKAKGEKESKEFIVKELTFARSIFFGLQNTQDLPTLPSEQKKKPNEGKIKKARDQMQKSMEAYHKAISHPYHFEEYMGLGHIFDPPEDASPDQHTTEDFREKRRQEVEAREKRFSSALRAMAEAHNNQFPEGSEVSAQGQE